MMKNMRMYIIAFAFAIVCLWPCAAEVIDKVAVIVNDEIITEGEVDRLLFPVYEKYNATYQGDALIRKLEEARQGVIEKLIDDRLLLGEAKKLNIEIDEAEVDERVLEVQSRLGSREALEKALGQQHMTIKDLRTKYRDQIMSRRVVDMKVGGKVAISPVEMQNYYDTHTNEFVLPDEVKVSNILIRPETNPAKKTQLAREILGRLKEGGDFAGLAKTYSEGPNAGEGGSMGYIKKGDLMPEIDKVIFSLKPGEVSDLIQTGVGYHIFKVEERREARVRPYSEVRKDVEEAIFRAKVEERVKKWLETLKKSAYIAFK